LLYDVVPDAWLGSTIGATGIAANAIEFQGNGRALFPPSASLTVDDFRFYLKNTNTGPCVVVGGTTLASSGISVSNNSASVTGATGSNYTLALVAGQKLMFGNQLGVAYIISSVNTDTSITLTTPFTGVTNASTSAIALYSGQTIDGLDSFTIGQNTSIEIASNGGKWNIIAEDPGNTPIFNGGLVVSNNTAITSISHGQIQDVADGIDGEIVVDDYGVSGTTNSPAFHGRAARGSFASPAAVQNGDLLASLAARGYGTTGFSSATAGRLGVYAAETWTDTANGTYLTLDLTPPGTVGKITALNLSYGSLTFATNNTTALILDSSQNATVTGNMSTTNGHLETGSGYVLTSASPHSMFIGSLNNSGTGVNTPGASTTIYPAFGNGNAISGDFIIQNGFPGASGSTTETGYDRHREGGKITPSSAPGTSGTVINLISMSTLTNSAIGGRLEGVVDVEDGSNHVSSVSFSLQWEASNSNGTVTAHALSASVDTSDTSTFTGLTTSVTPTVSGTNVLLSVTPTWSGGTPTIVRTSWNMTSFGPTLGTVQ
jgi:hypothetical protein